MWYIKSALKVLLKNPIIWILTIILAAVFAAPVYEPLRPAWILDEITREQSKEDYENAKTNYEFAFENPSFARNLETEKQLLELKRNIYESTTSAEYFDNNVKLIETELDQLQSGRSINCIRISIRPTSKTPVLHGNERDRRCSKLPKQQKLSPYRNGSQSL